MTIETKEIATIFEDTPEHLSELLERDEETARRILYLTGSYEEYASKIRSLNLVDISNESFTENFVAVIDKILKFLKHLVSDLMDGGMFLSGSFENIIFQTEELLTKTRSSRTINKNATFKINTRINNMCVRYRPITDVQALIANLRIMSDVVTSYYNYQNNDIYKASFSIPSQVSNEEQINNVVSDIINVSPIKLAKQSNVFSQKGNSIYSLHLMGNHRIVVTNRHSQYEPIEQIIGTSIKLDTSEYDPLPLPPEIEFQQFSNTIQVTVLRLVSKIAEQLARENNLNNRHRRKDRINSVIGSMEAIKKQILTESKIDHKLLRDYVSVLDSYMSWLSNPYLSLSALCSRNLYATLNVCKANL